MSKLIKHQEGQTYYIYHPSGMLLCQFWTGCDGQYAKDIPCLSAIGKAIAKRWGISVGND